MKRFATMLLAILLTVSICSSAMAVSFNYEGKEFEPMPGDTRLPVHIIHQSDPNLTYFGSDTEDENWYIHAIEEQLNIDIIYDKKILASNYYDTLSLILAQKDFADAMKVDRALVKELYEAGLLKDMTDIYNEYASDYLKDIYQYTGVIFDGCTFDGRLYALPRQESGNSGAPMIYIRQDWLDKLGLKAPETLEDLVNIARAFKTQDPDGNGVDDTWGIGVQNAFYRQGTGDGASSASLESFFFAKGAFPGRYYWNEDHTEVLFGGIQPEAKEALAYIADLVKEGVIEKEFATMSYDEVNEAVFTNRCGLVISPWWQCVGYDMCLEGDAMWRCYAAPMDDQGLYTYPMVDPAGEYVVVFKDTSDEVAQAIMKIINLQARSGYTASNDILPEVMNEYGVTGIFHSNSLFPFVMNFDPYNKHSSFAGVTMDYYEGKVSLADLPGEMLDCIPKFDVLFNKYNGDFKTYFMSEDFIPWVANYLVFLDSCLNLDKVDKAGKNHMVSPATFNPSVSEAYLEYSPTLMKLQSEYYTKIVLGESSLDAFDEFVSLWKTLGGEEVLEELTEALK